MHSYILGYGAPVTIGKILSFSAIILLTSKVDKALTSFFLLCSGLVAKASYNNFRRISISTFTSLLSKLSVFTCSCRAVFPIRKMLISSYTSCILLLRRLQRENSPLRSSASASIVGGSTCLSREYGAKRNRQGGTGVWGPSGKQKYGRTQLCISPTGVPLA